MLVKYAYISILPLLYAYGTDYQPTIDFRIFSKRLHGMGLVKFLPIEIR